MRGILMSETSTWMSGLALQHRQRLLAIAGLEHLKAGILQHLDRDASQHRFVFGNQDLAPTHASSASAASRW